VGDKKITITRTGTGNTSKNSSSGEIAAIDALNRVSGNIVHGVSGNLLQQNKVATENIRKAVAGAAQRVRRGTGEDITEFYSALALGNNDHKAQQSASGPLVKTVRDQHGNTRKLINIQDMIEHAAESGLNDLLMNETGRVEAYYDYLRIMDMIPQMAQAISTYTDNILSPDDFTKDSLDCIYDDTSLQGNRADIVNTRIKMLAAKYKLDDRSQKIISQALVKGDYFMAVIPLREELSKLLTEEEEVDQYNGRDSRLYSQRRLEESTHFAKHVESFVNKAHVILTEDTELDGKTTKKKTDAERIDIVKLEEKKLLTEAMAGVSKLINENVMISKSTSSLLAERAELRDAFADVIKERSKKLSANMGNPASDEDSNDPTPIDVCGSVIRILEPERVIKIEDGGICFGYVYFEQIPDHASDPDNIVINTTGSAYYSQNAGLAKILGSEKERSNAARRQFVYNMFVRGIADRLDRKVLAKNKQFADVIYHMLRQQSIVRKQLRITFIPPDQMVHFGNDDADQVYHDSIFKTILFTAKLYIAMLTSSLMHRLVRAPSKRIFYIEVGLDNDDGAAISSFIRDLKSKEIGFDDITGGGINNILSNIGTFNDIYCPVINGEKPIDVETIEENSPNMQDDFMEWLMKGLTSGVGIPHAFIADSESVQFARSLSMENAKFLRAVVRLQKKFGKQFSHLLQLLWRNEYELSDPVDVQKGTVLPPSESEETVVPQSDTDEINEEDIEDIHIVIEKLRIVFPSPASLNTTNTNEQISASQSIIDFIASIVCGPEGETDADMLVRAMKMEVAKKYVRLIDWDEVMEMLKAAKKNKIQFKLDEEDKPADANAMGGDVGAGDMSVSPDNTGEDMSQGDAESTDTTDEEPDNQDTETFGNKDQHEGAPDVGSTL
jgi:hypothetical protein